MTSVPGHNKYDLKYSLLTLRPDFVEQLAWGTQQLTSAEADQFRSVLVGGVDLLLRKDSEHVNWAAVPAQ